MEIVATSNINTDANNIKNCINNLSKDINAIQNCINYIPQVWSGKDSESFINKYKNEILPELKKYEKNLNDYYTFLSKVYDVFNTLDESYNKNISTD